MDYKFKTIKLQNGVYITVVELPEKYKVYEDFIMDNNPDSFIEDIEKVISEKSEEEIGTNNGDLIIRPDICTFSHYFIDEEYAKDCEIKTEDLLEILIAYRNFRRDEIKKKNKKKILKIFNKRKNRKME